MPKYMLYVFGALLLLWTILTAVITWNAKKCPEYILPDTHVADSLANRAAFEDGREEAFKIDIERYRALRVAFEKTRKSKSQLRNELHHTFVLHGLDAVLDTLGVQSGD